MEKSDKVRIMSHFPPGHKVSVIGRFQKISITYHGRLLGFPKGRGVHDYGILRAWGVFTIGNPKAWRNSTGGISGVESVE